MEDISEKLEYLAANFNLLADNTYFMKEKLSSLDQEYPIKINFLGCHVAISRNGGLVAICKKKSFLDVEKDTKINTKIIIMFQNAKTRYYIPINWNYSKRWVVCLDFNKNDKLFAICNDGIIYKFDLLNLQAKEILTCSKLKEEGVEKAKFFENGFIALTTLGTFYYIKDFKTIFATLLFPMGMILGFSNNIDFIAIPSSFSKSKKVELLITNEFGNGIVHVVQQPEGQNFGSKIAEDNASMEIIGVSILLNDKLEKYVKNSQKKNNGTSNGNYPNGIGKIVALAISPSKSKIALYNNDNSVAFLFSSNFEGPRKNIALKINEEDYSDIENSELKAILHYKEGYQFLFCGEDTIAVSGQRFIIVSDKNMYSLAYKVKEGGEMDAIQGALFSKCISEIDGLRYITNEGVFFISKVDKDLANVCLPFSDSNCKSLINLYKNYLVQKQSVDKDIRTLIIILPDIITSLLSASASLYWTDDENEDNKKEIQMFILRAAQYGKNFVQKEEFNFDKFVEVCREMRIINNLRNDEKHPMLITFKEYEDMDSKVLINKLLRYQNFKLAFEICKYLDINVKKVYQKFIVTSIKKFNEKGKEKEEKKYEDLIKKLNETQNISYIKLAKKAFKYGKNIIGMKFLEREKSSLIKIPQYIEHKEWEKAIELALKTFDSNIISTVLDKILKNANSPSNFLDLMCKYPAHQYKIMIYLKKNVPELVQKFLEYRKCYEELLYITLEKFFLSETFNEKKEIITKCKEYLKLIDRNSGFDYKYYKSYLDNLENSILFKKECMEPERNIIHYTDILPYKTSVYDCYKSGVVLEKFGFIETQNKTLEYSSKKLNIIRFRGYLDLGKPELIDLQLKKTSLKKLGLTPIIMAEIYFDYKYYDKASEYLLQVNESEYLDYKVEMFKYMEKYREALEAIISDKDNENMAFMVNNILSIKPRFKSYVDELCVKYKVDLN